MLATTSAACLVLASPRMAVAQGSDAAARAAAEELFQAARALMAAGDFTAACPKLEASLALYPALGVRLNLARCYEQIARPASAWLQYREVAERDGQTRRAEVARARVDALGPRLPRLVVQLASAEPIPGLVVTRDGATMEPALFDTVIHVDPGEREIRATAPGHLPFVTVARATMDEQVVVVVPSLQPEPAPPDAADGAPARAPQAPGTLATGAPEAAPAAPGALATGAGKSRPPGMSEPAPIMRARTDNLDTRRTVAWATGGAGAVMLASSLGFGLAARAAWDDARELGRCDPETLVCEDPRGPGMVETARSRARVSSIAASAGAVMLVTGAVFYWMSRDTAGDLRGAHVVPTAGQDGIGVAISGEF
ncbi:MAG TPA: hypothetical protein VNM90_28740 [Haliangium sp.]|nr:hypothetical protein [Haliangium sp.]